MAVFFFFFFFFFFCPLFEHIGFIIERLESKWGLTGSTLCESRSVDDIWFFLFVRIESVPLLFIFDSEPDWLGYLRCWLGLDCHFIFHLMSIMSYLH